MGKIAKRGGECLPSGITRGSYPQGLLELSEKFTGQNTPWLAAGCGSGLALAKSSSIKIYCNDFDNDDFGSVARDSGPPGIRALLIPGGP